MERIKNMTAGSPLKLILFFSFPLIAANIGQQLYMVVDAMIVGQGAGVEALASVGAADWSYWLALWAICALTQGFSIPISQAFGEGNYADVRKLTAASIYLSLIGAAALTVVCFAGGGYLLRILKTPDDIFDGALAYLLTMYGGLIVVTAYNMTSSLLRAFGDGRTSLVAIAIAAVMNIGLDLLFVLVFRWGIVGAAIASVIAQLFAFLYCLRILCRIKWLKLDRQDWRPDKKLILLQCRLGIPLALQNVLIAIGGMVLQSAINGQGFLFIAGFTATNKIYGLLESSAISLGYAVTTYTAQNYGAGLYRRIRNGLKCSLILSFLFSLSISAVMLAGGRFFLRLFIEQSSENADTVLQIAYRYLCVLSWMLIILYLLHVFRNILQGMGNSFVPFLSGIMEFSARVSVALFFSEIWGAQAIFLAEPFAWTAAALILAVLCIRKIRHLPIEKADTNDGSQTLIR